MSTVAPENAAYVRLVFFCSQLWMTKAYYDDASITYMETVTPDQLPELIESRIDQGEIQYPLSKQLSDAIRHVWRGPPRTSGSSVGECTEASGSFGGWRHRGRNPDIRSKRNSRVHPILALNR